MPDQNDLTLGIDVSRYQGRIDWQGLTQGGVQYPVEGKVLFSIAKATQASSYVDPIFDTNWLGMRKVGLIRGAYHYFEPAVDPIDQAENFLRVIGGILHFSDLPPILDVEYWPPWARDQWDAIKNKERVNRVRKWLDHVETSIGRKPIIYTSGSSWFEITGNNGEFSDHPLWVANYGVENPIMPANNWGGNGFTIWQFTDRGKVSGVNGATDLNWFNGSLDELKVLLKIEGQRPQPAEVTNIGMLIAVRNAAERLGLTHDELLDKAKLEHLRDSRNRERPYNGLAIEEMDLTPDEATALNAALDESVDELEIPLSGMTNQDVINALYRVAEKIGIPGFDLIIRAGQAEMADDRLALYTGPSIDDLPGLTDFQKGALLEALGLAPMIGDIPETPTYPGVMNQAMINLFYRAAAMFNLDGWTLIERADLDNMAASPEDRANPYTGPKVEYLPNLSEGEKGALLAALEAQFVATSKPTA